MNIRNSDIGSECFFVVVRFLNIFRSAQFVAIGLHILYTLRSQEEFVLSDPGCRFLKSHFFVAATLQYVAVANL